jgi:hypothetical protein
MGLFITPQVEIDAYFASENINQSTLKNLEGGLGGLLANIAKRKKDKIENKPPPDYFLIGGAVDCILTGEAGEYEKQYYVSHLEKKPSDAEMLIVNQVFDELVREEIEIDLGLDGYLEMLAIAIVDQQWYKGNPGEKRTQGLLERCTPYFEDKKDSIGKKILSTEEANNINNIVNSLRHNPKTSKYFNRALQAAQEDMDFYYQLPIYFLYKGQACKALMDMVVVYKDSEGKITKIEPIDLKTMSGSTLQFGSKIKQHRYDIQAAWYTKALSSYFVFAEQNIDAFKFVVESTTGVGTPLVFEITNETLHHGRWGANEGYFVSEDEQRELYFPARKGYVQLMEEYIYYQDQGFTKDIIFEKYPDVVKVDWLKGIV